MKWLTHLLSAVSGLVLRTTAIIRKDGPSSKPYCVYSKDGKKKLGCYKTRKLALKRIRQIEHFKGK